MTDVRWEIVLATPALAERLAPNLRPEDEAEVLASHGWSPSEALCMSLAATPEPWALLVDGEPVGMWGVEPISIGAGIGVPWLLGAPGLVADREFFWDLCRQEVACMLDTYRVLFNFVDARYEKSLRWAKKLGFRVDEPRPFGPSGAPFCAIAIAR